MTLTFADVSKLANQKKNITYDPLFMILGNQEKRVRFNNHTDAKRPGCRIKIAISTGV